LVTAAIGQQQQIQELIRRFCAARFELGSVSLAVRFELLQERRDGRRAKNQQDQ